MSTITRTTTTTVPTTTVPTTTVPTTTVPTTTVPTTTVPTTPNRAVAARIPRARSSPSDDLVTRAQRGDQEAWRALVTRYNGLLVATARRLGLPAPACDDVAQVTWMRLFEHLDQIRDLTALPAWLITTSRREALNVLRRQRRELPCDDSGFDAEPDPATSEPDRGLILELFSARLHSALNALPDRDRRLIAALFHPTEPSYQEIAALLGMPVGSIGPIRQRILSRLRARLSDLDPHVDAAWQPRPAA